MPLRGPVYEPVADLEPQWTNGQYFPHFPASDRVYAFRLPAPLSDWRHGAIREHWRINRSHDVLMALTLVGMQGVINRSGPRLFVEWYDPLLVDTLLDVSDTWTPVLEEEVEVVSLNLDSVSALSFLLDHYGGRFNGAVVYDPEVPDTINLATMLAGLEDRVMLVPEQLQFAVVVDALQQWEGQCSAQMNPHGLPTQLGMACVTDLRQLARQEAWDATIEGQTRLYQWAVSYTHLTLPTTPYV